MQSKIDKYVNWALPFLLGIGIYVLLYVSSNFEDEIFSWEIPTYFVGISALIMWVVKIYLNKNSSKGVAYPLGGRHFIVALILAIGIYMISYLGMKTTLIVLTNQDDAIDIRHITLSAVQATIMSLIIVGAQFLIISTKAWTKSQIRSERLLKENTEARLQNLKMQLSPHFLFNSFNTLESLIHRNPKEASLFLMELADLYRAVLKNGEKTIILLNDEIEMIKHFNALMYTRFGDNYFCEIDIPEKVLHGFYVPPLSLQLLLENAVKHNCIDITTKLNCKIYFDDNYIKVRNRINLRDQGRDSIGLGLNNLVGRYDFLSDLPVQIREEEGVFEVGIPVLDIEIHNDKKKVI